MRDQAYPEMGGLTLRDVHKLRLSLMCARLEAEPQKMVGGGGMDKQKVMVMMMMMMVVVVVVVVVVIDATPTTMMVHDR